MISIRDAWRQYPQFTTGTIHSYIWSSIHLHMTGGWIIDGAVLILVPSHLVQYSPLISYQMAFWALFPRAQGPRARCRHWRRRRPFMSLCSGSQHRTVSQRNHHFLSREIPRLSTPRSSHNNNDCTAINRLLCRQYNVWAPSPMLHLHVASSSSRVITVSTICWTKAKKMQRKWLSTQLIITCSLNILWNDDRRGLQIIISVLPL